MPAQASAPSLSRYWYRKLLAGTVIACTTITAAPRPMAVSICLETARKVHMPRKNDSARFSVKIDAINRLR